MDYYLCADRWQFGLLRDISQQSSDSDGGMDKHEEKAGNRQPYADFITVGSSCLMGQGRSIQRLAIRHREGSGRQGTGLQELIRIGIIEAEGSCSKKGGMPG